MAVNRKILESPIRQGIDEIISYQLTTTPWGSSPSAISVKAYESRDGAWVDVTSTVMPTNTPTALGDVITLSPLKLLTAGYTYRVEIKFTAGGNTYEPFLIVEAER